MLYYLWLRPNCCPLREERAAAKYKLKGKLSVISHTAWSIREIFGPKTNSEIRSPNRSG